MYKNIHQKGEKEREIFDQRIIVCDLRASNQRPIDLRTFSV